MVYAIIPIKDRFKKTLLCLKAFSDQSYKDIEIIVVDDGSVDGSADEIHKRWNNIEVLKGDGNLWCMGSFAKGVDYVMKKAKKGDFILTQNQDAEFEPDFVNVLVEMSDKYGRAIVGSINIKSDKVTPIYHNHILKYGRYQPNIVDGLSLHDNYLESDTLTTRGTIFPVEVFQKIGNFSKLFPQYAGDYHIVCKAKRNGFKVFVCPKAVTYSQDDNKGLAVRIKEKNQKSFKDVVNLFFSRRSSNNLYYSSLFMLLDSPFPQNIYGILRMKVYAIKFFFWDYLIRSIIKK